MSEILNRIKDENYQARQIRLRQKPSLNKFCHADICEEIKYRRNLFVKTLEQKLIHIEKV